ncbi:hypothetical protein CANARDRAFT_8931 [[Candida] arabinofermentans NRRL YB-2248]|uniref:Calcineurin-like phosphoesterase domain-containing protein n=1 Tax=[Candida] arabinofermentans NRRL YB-2248 TaxID=983967 RepID=A0A1E4SXP3_9ASCO|nr:hypothetical protein CANARDRAFT_8931 [[Candida] arabinofermentans NRRL YB-2248]
MDLEFQKCGMLSGSCETSSNWKDNPVYDSDIPTMWFKLPKNLDLKQSWMTSERYLFKKTILSKHAIEHSISVVNDIAIENKIVDEKIPNNQNSIPITIINDFNPTPISPEDLLDDNQSESYKTFLESITIPTEEMVTNEGWHKKDYGLWVKYGTFSATESITDINVLFGQGCVDPRPDWTVENFPLKLNLKYPETTGKYDKLRSNIHDSEVYLTCKRGLKTTPNPKISLSFDRTSRKFKILQVADLHFSTGHGECRDTFPAVEGECLADEKTLKFLEHVLDIEKPDLVALTGDQIFGEASPDAQTAMYKAVAPFIKRQIPFAMTFGNHDDEGSLSREQLMKLVSSLPYSLSVPGPDGVSGVGNYVLSVSPSSGRTDYNALSIYFLDSHKYAQGPKQKGYDYLKEDQLEFVMSKSEDVKGKNDLVKGSINKKISPYNPLSMAFFHIPLPEYRNFKNEETGAKRKVIGSYKEAVTAPFHNSGMKQMLSEVGVSVVSVGHDHCNDYCVMDDIWLCYGGAVGEGGYAGYGGTNRRLRLYEVNEQRGMIDTWKRLESEPDMIYDAIILVDKGQVITST